MSSNIQVSYFSKEIKMEMMSEHSKEGRRSETPSDTDKLIHSLREQVNGK